MIHWTAQQFILRVRAHVQHHPTRTSFKNHGRRKPRPAGLVPHRRNGAVDVRPPLVGVVPISLLRRRRSIRARAGLAGGMQHNQIRQQQNVMKRRTVDPLPGDVCATPTELIRAPELMAECCTLVRHAQVEASSAVIPRLAHRRYRRRGPLELVADSRAHKSPPLQETRHNR